MLSTFSALIYYYDVDKYLSPLQNINRTNDRPNLYCVIYYV